MDRAAYEDKILRVADRIRERRENEGTARAYVDAKARIAAGQGTWIDQMAVESLEAWMNSPSLILGMMGARDGDL